MHLVSLLCFWTEITVRWAHDISLSVKNTLKMQIKGTLDGHRPNTKYQEKIIQIRDCLSAICWCLVQKQFCGLLVCWLLQCVLNIWNQELTLAEVLLNKCGISIWSGVLGKWNSCPHALIFSLHFHHLLSAERYEHTLREVKTICFCTFAWLCIICEFNFAPLGFIHF